MMTPTDLRRTVDEDVTEMPRDILEFNYKATARGALAWIEMIDKQHQDEVARLRYLMGTAEFVAILMAETRRAGRKTVRIEDVLGEAERRQAARGKH